MTYEITSEIEEDDSIRCTAMVEGREMAITFPSQYREDRDSIVQQAIEARLNVE